MESVTKNINLVVILGMEPKADGSLKDSLKERLVFGAKFFQKLREHSSRESFFIVVTGGKTTVYRPESSSMKQFLINEYSLLPDDIIEEPISYTTVENALCIRDHIIGVNPLLNDFNKVFNIYVVTSDYHMDRSKRIFIDVFSRTKSYNVNLLFEYCESKEEKTEQFKKFLQHHINITASSQSVEWEKNQADEWKPLSLRGIHSRLGEFFDKDLHKGLVFTAPYSCIP